MFVFTKGRENAKHDTKTLLLTKTPLALSSPTDKEGLIFFFFNVIKLYQVLSIMHYSIMTYLFCDVHVGWLFNLQYFP